MKTRKRASIGDTHYSVPKLRARGWTKTASERFLPEPDETRPNPHYSHAGAPMKFWLMSRVHRIERTKAFLAWQQGSVGRKASANAGVSTRISNMMERMETVEITIKSGVSTERIRELAMATHGGNYRGTPGEFRWCNRTARNCIRHNLTNYEALWSLCNRGETGEDAYQILRDRVDDLINETYPQFQGDDDINGATDQPVIH